jgi:RNA polymerase sigma factor (sigma-70 family)
MMEELCGRLANDLDGAFPELVVALQSDVYSGLRRLTGNSHDAEDLTQETFIRAYRALRNYQRPRIRQLKLRAWIWTIALNLGRNHARDRARRPYPMLFEESPVNDPEPADTNSWDRWLARLPPAQRRGVVLRHVVGLSYEEIAEALARPEGTVKADVHRGLSRLRNLIEEES